VANFFLTKTIFSKGLVKKSGEMATEYSYIFFEVEIRCVKSLARKEKKPLLCT